jgi:hypothetical protein
LYPDLVSVCKAESVAASVFKHRHHTDVSSIRTLGIFGFIAHTNGLEN